MQQRNGHTNSGAPAQGKAEAEGHTMTNTMWRCVQWRAGQILNKVLFNSKSEAEKFCAQMHRAEPDIFWRMEPVEARLVWN
jgi:hypothetical protein